MKICITKKYLVFPVNTQLPRKKVVFARDGETVYRLNLALDAITPNFSAYIDVSRFLGEELTLTVTPHVEVLPRESDTMDIPNLYGEPLRPAVHFTTRNGWHNDPNGLCYVDGVYHMFYQYNPGEPKWENMHWGHAVSADLLRWEERDTVLYPDEMGTMFSGCAVRDERNLLSDVTGADGAMLLYYTAAGKPFTQCMAYSTDGFQTVTKYAGNPVLPNVIGSNRDPKVHWCKELGCYVMALYLTENLFALYTSSDLLNWEELQRIPLEGDRECPDFFPLTDADGVRWWVLIAAADKYLVGQIQERAFVPRQPVQSLHFGVSAYAGQTFHGLENGRVVRIVWERWGALSAPGFSQQMSIPMELSLKPFGDTVYLSALPVRELESLVLERHHIEALRITPEAPYRFPMRGGTAQIIRLRGVLAERGTITLTVFGRTVECNMTENTIRYGKSVMPLSYTGAELDLTVITDRCSVEIFSDGGRMYLTDATGTAVMDRNQPVLSVASTEPYALSELEVSPLASLWGG